jgi:Glyoxalase-like domain
LLDRLGRAEEHVMAAKFQITIDCANPDRLAHFWVEALGYRFQAPPAPFASWGDYWRGKGVPEDELEIGEDRIEDPAGAGPDIWFHQVPEKEVVKNRLHFDIRASGGREVPLAIRKKRVDAAAERLAQLGAKILEVWDEAEIDHYATAMQDPEENEFDIN